MLSPTDAGMLPPGCELWLDYYEDLWGSGFQLSSGYSDSCGVP